MAWHVSGLIAGNGAGAAAFAGRLSMCGRKRGQKNAFSIRHMEKASGNSLNN
jgi:hypothetical protein